MQCGRAPSNSHTQPESSWQTHVSAAPSLPKTVHGSMVLQAESFTPDLPGSGAAHLSSLSRGPFLRVSLWVSGLHSRSTPKPSGLQQQAHGETFPDSRDQLSSPSSHRTPSLCWGGGVACLTQSSQGRRRFLQRKGPFLPLTAPRAWGSYYVSRN